MIMNCKLESSGLSPFVYGIEQRIEKISVVVAKI
jgi:hypothetical protein